MKIIKPVLFAIYAMGAGLLISWYVQSQLDDPWLRLSPPLIIYTPHNDRATIHWEFRLNRPCNVGATLHYLIVLWDGDLRAFPGSKQIYEDEHGEFTEEFLWPQEWTPHGATTRVIATCLTRTPELIISPPGSMRVMDLRGLPAKPEDFVAVRKPRTANPG